MEKIITAENIRNFAYVNDQVCARPIRGIVINFLGLNSCTMWNADSMEGQFYGEKGVLYMIPYYNPWGWMNRQAVDYVDELIDVLIVAHHLPDDLPIVSTGGSMGGQAALTYCRYAKRTPAACVANCPVCDVPYHFTERPDLPRTFYSALYAFDGTMEEGLKTLSPLHLAASMPRIPYRLFHCTDDQAVNLQRHSQVFVDEMKKFGHDITLDLVPGRGHCDLTYPARLRYVQCILDAVENGAKA